MIISSTIILIVLDGWGYARASAHNAITLSKTPVFNQLWQNYPHTLLQASGPAVGLPEGQQGGSEVGHLNLGAGRVVEQDLIKINRSIADGTFFKNATLLNIFKQIKENKTNLHIMGLIGNGGIHAHENHWQAILEFCHREKFSNKVFLHLFTDGRDAPPTAGINHLEKIEEMIKEYKVGQIVSVSGRYYAMDRDKRLDRTEKCLAVLINGKGNFGKTADSIIKESYKNGLTDEFILPSVILDQNNHPTGLVKNNDTVFFLNFRSDRPRQLCEMLLKNRSITLITMTEYLKNLTPYVLFPPHYIKKTLSEIISSHNMKQLHIAETEKYAHITYFFDGGREQPLKNEDFVCIPSPRVATYDLEPQMSAVKITNEVLQKISSKMYNFILINFANADMVGHTGKLNAAIKGIETIDSSLGKIMECIDLDQDTVIITGDHGNAENLADIEHSCAPVPLIIVNNKLKGQKINETEGKLADIAPTVLSLLHFKKPVEMNGENLLLAMV